MGRIVLGSAIELVSPKYANEVRDGIITIEQDSMRIKADWYWQEWKEIPTAWSSEEIVTAWTSQEIQDPATSDPLATVTVQVPLATETNTWVVATATVESGDPVLRREVSIAVTGEQFNTLRDTEISSGHVGQKFFTLMRKFARNKIKAHFDLQGVDND